MKMKTIASSIAVGLALLAGASAHAITISNTDGTMNWSGFDWDSNGTAYTTGFVPAAGDTFELNFFSWATALKNGPNNILGLRLDSIADGIAQANGWYEYTVYAKLQETVVGCTGNTCTFAVTSGDFYIYYDTTPDANAGTNQLGTGFRDGDLLIQGSFAAQDGGTFTVTGSGGQGVTTLQGQVGYTNTTFINPALSDTVVGTTLQLGDAVTNGWTSPGGFDGSAFPGGEVVFQADANQSFTANVVPEPASLGLVAVGLLAGGLVSRRRRNK